MRVIFIVRCHGEPDEETEESLMRAISEVVEIPKDWGILTIGRQYYHDIPDCEGHSAPHAQRLSCQQRRTHETD